MQVSSFTHIDPFRKDPNYPVLQRFLGEWPDSHFFQSPEFLEFIAKVPGYQPVLLVATGADGEFKGSILGVVQADGKGPKSWFSRRMIVWGGPVVAPGTEKEQLETAGTLLKALKRNARGKAIYIEFRNYFDTSPMRAAFEANGFEYKEHLNLLVKLGDEESVLKRMGRDRKRQVRISLETGAEVREPVNEEEVRELYDMLDKLYRERVKKPLPDFGLFRQFWTSPNGKMFIVVYNGKVMGGAAGPIYRNKTVYQWYLCGENGVVKNLHSSVLATWGQIDFGIKNGYELFDFMGAGKPDEAYGVREFKASFGGELVSHGRYEMILSPILYKVGKFGLKIYHKLPK